MLMLQLLEWTLQACRLTTDIFVRPSCLQDVHAPRIFWRLTILLVVRLQLAIYLSICNLPWIFKPVIGFVSDTVPLWGYRRRSYLLLAGVTASLAWLTLWGEAQNIPGKTAPCMILQVCEHDCPMHVTMHYSGQACTTTKFHAQRYANAMPGGCRQPVCACLPAGMPRSTRCVNQYVYVRAGTIALILICSSAGAVSDVVADSLVVERARDEPQESAGSLQAMCWTWHAVGQVATAALGGSLVQEYGPRAVFGLTGAFPTLIMLAAFVVQEEPVRKGAAAVVSTIVMPIAMLQPAGADSASHDSGGLPAAASTAAVRATVAASSTASTTTGAVSSSSNSLSGKPGMPSAAASPGMASTPLVGLGSLIRGFYDQVSTLSVAMKDKDITPALAFLFLLSATPSYDDAIFYFHVRPKHACLLLVAACSLQLAWLN